MLQASAGSNTDLLENKNNIPIITSWTVQQMFGGMEYQNEQKSEGDQRQIRIHRRGGPPRIEKKVMMWALQIYYT